MSAQTDRSVPLLFALPLAVAGGLLLDLATPEVAWWPGAFLGVIAVLTASWQRRAWSGLLIGVAAGCAFWLPHISWLTLYLGPVPWLGLSGVMIVWFGLMGALIALATRWLAGLRAPDGVVVAAQAVTVTGIWVLREGVQMTWPYGGFAWGRLAHTQAEGPLAAVVSWVGLSGLTALIALACAMFVGVGFSVVHYLVGRQTGPASDAPPAEQEPQPRVQRAMRWSLWATASTVVLLVALSLLPPAQLPVSGTITVAAVQGNSKSGIFDDRENGDVFRAHLNETELMLDEFEREGVRVDAIVWPENSAEFGLPGNRLRSAAVTELADRAGAPIVVGSVLKNSDGSFTNSSLVYDGNGATGARYDKMNPVPFAEYMPDRAFFRALAPSLVDLVQLEYRPGTLPAALPVGDFLAGAAICFDIVVDRHSGEMVNAGANVIFAQTNNADFGTTDESAQQLGIARLRVIETGRALVNISTVATSAIVDRDGRTLAAIEPHVAGWMVAEVPLVSGETPGTVWGGLFAGGWMVVGAIGMLAAAATRFRARER